jgi:group I intron endonuclease
MRGIYIITNSITGTVYYGQSKHISKRLKQHASDLRRNAHDNPKLQNSWNKYGEGVFLFKPFKIIEDITIDLTPIEKKYFDKTINKFNISDPEQPPSCMPETRKKISKALIGNKWNKGRKHTKETKRNMSIGKTGKLRAPFSKKTRLKMSIAKKHYWDNKD